MAAAVVLDRRLDRVGDGREATQQVLDRELGERRLGDQGLVQIVDVGLVVLVVVDLHRARVEMRLEGVEGIGQFGKFVHGWFLLGGSILRASFREERFKQVTGRYWTKGVSCALE